LEKVFGSGAAESLGKLAVVGLTADYNYSQCSQAT
jgi:hypothetical protein